jgi:hypothetical protein
LSEEKVKKCMRKQKYCVVALWGEGQRVRALKIRWPGGLLTPVTGLPWLLSLPINRCIQWILGFANQLSLYTARRPNGQVPNAFLGI